MEDLLVNPKEDKKFKINFDFLESRAMLYAAIFYCCGLFLGSNLYKIVQSEGLNKLLKPENQSLLNLFSENLCIYMAVFLIVVFLGFCLIGYPLINIIPAVIGIIYGMKIAYFYINYSTKGVGYSIIMLVPFAALFLTVIGYSIDISAKMSKKLIDITKNGLNGEKYDIKPYLKQFLILGVLIIVLSFASAGMTTLLTGVVTI